MLTKRYFAPDTEGVPTEPIAPEPTEPVTTGDEEFDLPEELNAEIAPATDEEFEDFDFDGVKGKVQKGRAQEIRDAMLRDQDYRNKTKEVARREKEAEQVKVRYEESLKEDETFREGLFHLKMVDNDLKTRIDYLNSPAFKQLQTDDPIEAQRIWNEYQMAKDRRGELASLLARRDYERKSKAEAEAREKSEADAKRRDQLPREIAKLVPGWNADMAGKVKEFGVSMGYAPEALDSTTDPLHFKTLYLARIGQMALASKARQGKGAAEVKEAQPTKTVGQRGGVNVSSEPKDSDDMETWMKKEQAREAKQRAAR